MQFQGMESITIDLLRTEELQRLRRIRQMGLGYLVFPGAEHSRLAHSLGAAHLAIQFGHHLQEASRDMLVELMRPSEDSIRDLAIAALCHDLGHGPLSHAWEREVVRDFSRNAWITSLGLQSGPGVDSLRWHELVTQALLGWEDGELHQLLENQEIGLSARIRAMLRGRYYLEYLPRLLDSDIDVDRADFLLRDAFQCGVAYGRYDVGWLISTCTLGVAADNRWVIGWDRRKALRIVEQLMIAREALYHTAYWHKTVVSAEAMVGLFLRRYRATSEKVADNQISDLMRPFARAIGGSALSPREVLALDDFGLWVFITYAAGNEAMDAVVRDLGQRIIRRDLFKLVPVRSERLQEFLSRPERWDEIVRVVSKYAPGEPSYYVHLDSHSFDLFQNSPSTWAFFVDESHKASPIREDADLRQYVQGTRTEQRLYALREARDDLATLIK